MVKSLSERTPAKVNLFLRVTGRRPDGYHELDSVFVPVSIYDRVDIELRPALRASVQIRCDSDVVPLDERNLAFRAAREFMAEFGVSAEVLIDLRKEIPVGAGLGGGSSDAGAVLRMMAVLCGTDQSPRVAGLAVRLGADVPFFLNPAPSRVRGIGERIEALGHVERTFMLVVVPPIEVSTASIFQDLRPHHWSGPAPERDIRAIIQGRVRPQNLVNDLEDVVFAKWPEIEEVKKLLKAAGARACGMTGSGGGIFGVFDSSEQVTRVGEVARSRAPHLRTFATSVS